MKVGTLCYATDQGLGVLAKSFYDAGVVTDAYVIYHPHRPTHHEWYKNSPGSKIRRVDYSPDLDRIREFCSAMDLMLFFETPFVWSLFVWCREQGVKTVLMPMYECCPPRKALPYQPDAFLCPSLLDLDYYGRADKNTVATPFAKGFGNAVFSPIPVQQPWKERTIARTFVHNGGWGGLLGRNGTLEIERAIPLVKTPARFIVRMQKELPSWRALEGKQNVDLRMGTQPSGSLYDEGDVFLFPEKFNGLSLPLQEAYASGMLVMAGERFPMVTWLPNEPLIPKTGVRENRIAGRCNTFEEALYEPADIAAKIDEWYGHDISSYSRQGREWARQNSWAVLKPLYESFFHEVVEGAFP